MLRTKNIKNWIDCCAAVRGKTDHMISLGSVDLWNQRADGFAKSLKPGKRPGRMKEIFELLKEAGFQAEGARVLDIGCGPGAISIPLARAGAEVTSLDISYKALEYLKANAKEESLPIETIECSWWKANIDKLGLRNKFDLVVTSMTPAVKDDSAFDRMMACSRNFCYYSHFLKMGHNRNNEEIVRNVLKKESPRQSGGIPPFVNNFIYLYLHGYRPLVRIQHKKHKVDVAWDEAADHAIKSLEHAGSCSAADKKKIREYYKTSAVDGKYRTHSDGYTGMMVWNVNAKEQYNGFPGL
jgi:SAM-dependent methyltransferase